jgi:hypothetical protein
MTFADHPARQKDFREALADRDGNEKVGNAEVEAEDVMDFDDLYDSERIAISGVMAALGQRIGTGMEGSAFQREVRERFAEIGFVARCDLKKDMLDPRPWDDKPWVPDISIIGRTEKQGEFDHERMGHEVRSNILGKNEQGAVQKTQVAPGWSQSKSGLVLPD